MIPSGVQIFVSVARVDMRYGFERLAGLVRDPIGYDARSGALFVCNRSAKTRSGRVTQ